MIVLNIKKKFFTYAFYSDIFLMKENMRKPIIKIPFNYKNYCVMKYTNYKKISDLKEGGRRWLFVTQNRF